MCHVEKLHRFRSRAGHIYVGITDLECPAVGKSRFFTLEPANWKATSPEVGDALVIMEFQNLDLWLIHLLVPTDGICTGVCSTGKAGAMYLVLHIC
jgi:hypothetical protein